MPADKSKSNLDLDRLKKGGLLVVKAPPFFDKEYIYEISGAGGKQIRANLYHSPKVKKQWSLADLEILFENKIIRFAEEADMKKHVGKSTNTSAADTDSDTSQEF